MKIRNFFYLLLSITLLSVGCSSDDNPPFPEVETTNIRLKRLTSEQEVVNALGAYVQGWDIGLFTLTRDEGEYPFWYYQFDFNMRTDGAEPTTHHYRHTRADTDGPIDLEEIQRLEELQNRVRVHDARLDKYPSLYVNKRRENDNNEWNFTLYAHQVEKNGNRFTHRIFLSGGHTTSYIEGTIPPPTDEEAITAMFGLLEEHD